MSYSGVLIVQQTVDRFIQLLRRLNKSRYADEIESMNMNGLLTAVWLKLVPLETVLRSQWESKEIHALRNTAITAMHDLDLSDIKDKDVLKVTEYILTLIEFAKIYHC